MTNQVSHPLAESFLFHELTDEERAITEEHMYESRLEKGESLFNEGDDGDLVCFVESGVLQVLKKNSAGQNIDLAHLGAGDCIGEMAIINLVKRSATVKALEETTLLILSKKGFDLLLEQHPKIGVTILKSFARLMSERLRSTSAELADVFTS
jgi:CRP/FNR family transcriptional regulator, cyclic AMP receptor protein